MTDSAPTHHNSLGYVIGRPWREQQRAILPSDLEIILAFGSEVEGGILVREKDVECAERALRNIVKRVQKVKGKRLVMVDGYLVTAYHATDRERHRLMRSRH